ncbi:putative F-box protein At5g14160 isoform X2 [Lolium rigidum]|uniref:putative F-box protein At5g14160 isoform X1 n=1 Tax=Lolium rigidum TaxID=89674 RepID=UPI001F5C4AB4|nr:putative F-box protein At5g14160 isoform X1 [Lolium rigidum]XP_047053305.1 putative F-box protein At5g14160 isoform X2 [Lolium rigidum]
MSAKVSRLPEVNSARMADWANLQTDIVGSIVRKLAIPDYIRFRAVCTSWNRVCVCRDVSNDPRVDPWLMLPTKTLEDAKFFSIPERKNETIRILSTATIFGSVWTPVGSSHGWLVFFNLNQGTIQLVNPISGGQFELPPLGREHFSKAVLLDMSESNFSVAIVYGNRKGYKVTRKGSRSWSFVDSKHILIDIFKHRRQLYTIDIYGTIEVWAEPPRSWPDADGPLVDPYMHPSLAQRKFNCLVETPAGDLVKVKRQSQNKFAAWILNRETSSFERTEDIGEFALFVSHHNSFCFPTKDHLSLKANCVYFIDNYKNLCAFNLEHGTKELIQGLETPALPRQDAFLWFIPSLK